MEIAIAECGDAFQFASEELKFDKDIAMAAVLRRASALKLIPLWFQNHRDFIFDAVRTNGDVLRFVTNPELRQDRHIIKAAHDYWQQHDGKVDVTTSPRRGDAFLRPAHHSHCRDYEGLMKSGGELGVRLHP